MNATRIPRNATPTPTRRPSRQELESLRQLRDQSLQIVAELVKKMNRSTFEEQARMSGFPCGGRYAQ